MEALQNPLRNPNDADVDRFIEEAKANKVQFIPQAMPDIEKVKGKHENILGFIPTEPVQAFLKDLKAGKIDKGKAKQALIEKYLFEGRIYLCHELQAMPRRQHSRRRPNGRRIQTKADKLYRKRNNRDHCRRIYILEGCQWRPVPSTEATPWDSAMPAWKTDLPDEYRWRIILAEYDLAQKTPRQPEKGGRGKERDKGRQFTMRSIFLLLLFTIYFTFETPVFPFSKGDKGGI